MEIRYIGHSSFYIKTKEARLVTDPFDPEKVGLAFPKTEADIVTISHQHSDHNYIKGVTGDPLIIDWPGEFEKNNVRVFGYRWYHDDKKGQERGENTLYKIEAENISILHCGDIGVMLTDQLLEEIGNIDILMVPTGGFFTIDAAAASSLIKKIDPSMVIPMHYNNEKLNQQTFASLAPLSAFLKEMGIDTPIPQDKLVVKKEDLSEEMKVVVMQMGK